MGPLKVNPNHTKIVFTSTKSGDLELWTVDIDGKSNMKQVGEGPAPSWRKR